MTLTWRRELVERSWRLESATHLVRTRGRSWDPSLPPVINLHGWSGDRDWTSVLMEAASRPPALPTLPSPPFGHGGFDVLVATGRTIYSPFLGSNWGTNVVYPSGYGGTGLQGIDDAIAAAAADGLPTGTVDVVATSAGACSALVWGWQNPSALRRMYLMIPGFDLSYAYDVDTEEFGLPPIAEYMNAIYGVCDKTQWLAESADVDPYRNTLSVATIADRIAIFASRDDQVVPWANLEPWCSGLGIPLTASDAPGVPGGGHFTPFDHPGWDDVMPAAWLNAP